MKERIFVYEDPAPGGGNMRVFMKESEVIEYMKEMGYSRPPTDDQLIDEFCIVHWAWEHKPEKEKKMLKNEMLNPVPDPKHDIPVGGDNWKHRSSGMICATCMFFMKKEPKTKGLLFGRCRRHAPTMSGFPAVFGSDWCGDHKLNEKTL